MNAELAVEAVKWLAGIADERAASHLAVIRNALRDQEAEIATLKACLANAEKAAADYRESLVSIFRLVRERDDRELQKHMEANPITAHLGGEQ